MSAGDYRTALVTGASSGIGLEIATRLAGLGLTVHALARDRARLDRLSAECGARVHAVDVRSGTAVEAMLGGLEIDILVNAAGVNRPGGLSEMGEEGVDAIIDTNLKGTINLCRLVAPGMAARDRGHIINLGSISGLHAFEGNAVYHASKAGLHGFTAQLRHELFGTRVRVTEIAPGRVATEIFTRTFGPERGRSFLEGYEALTPADIADAVLFAIAAPARVSVTLIEVWPTFQAIDGLRFARREPGGRG